MASAYSIVITTTGDKQTAQTICAHILREKLAACVQIFPIESHYVWHGAIQQDSEFTLHIKTRTENFDALSESICGLHSYDVPEIIRIDISAGNRAYLEWIDQVATPDSPSPSVA